MFTVEFLWYCGGMGWGGWGLHSHFHVQPSYSVEVVLRCVVVGVVTKSIFKQSWNFCKANNFFLDGAFMFGVHIWF